MVDFYVYLWILNLSRWVVVIDLGGMDPKETYGPFLWRNALYADV